MPLTDDQRIALYEGVHAPSHARAWLSERIAEIGLGEDVVQDALLLVSELVTNAVRHGRPDVELRMLVRPGRLRLAVHDCGEALPVLGTGPIGPDRTSGRGLLIVAATAAEWGVTSEPGVPGKTVWVDLVTA